MISIDKGKGISSGLFSKQQIKDQNYKVQENTGVVEYTTNCSVSYCIKMLFYDELIQGIIGTFLTFDFEMF